MSNENSILANINNNQSELQQAVEITKAVAKIGFDWPNVDGVIDKIHEEIAEVKHEISSNGSSDRLQDEVGDLLFAVCNLARHLNINPHSALASTNAKFIRRFQYIEQQVSFKNKTLSDYTLSELDAFWGQAKQQEK
jgi:MazG family protein